jgi:hypothetical protein
VGYTVDERRCLACGESFVPCKTVKDQKYCSKPECQRERKRRWQRAKIAEDPDYSENHRAAQQRWRENNPDYWRNYRATHKKYTRRNRKRQRERNLVCRYGARLIAKMDASDSAAGAVKIACELVILREDLIAKKDVIRAALRFASDRSVAPGG